MSFPFNLYLLSALAAALTAAASVPIWRAACLRLGLIDEPGPRKIHATPVPLAGGLALLTGLCVPVAAGAVVVVAATAGADIPVLDMGTIQHLIYGLGKRALQLFGIVAGAFAITCLGLVDDKLELGPAKKFAGQLVVAILVAATGTRITLFVESALFSYAITVLWILALINALNFMDNMNGLCAGLGVICAWYFGLCAAQAGQYLVATMALLMCGALLGFIPYNFPKAVVFLGDSGSQLVGYMLAVLGILPHFYTPAHPRPAAVLIPLLVLAVPLADMVWVVTLRAIQRQPIYVGDTSHISHQLVRSGLTERLAVLVLLLAATITGALGLLLAS
ncbi:MAG: MraY family glycosyltransferase [Verrucomicrobiales bacterium]|nr:MraY family glycosyltransferase [Verrucomicrobiales bacterium]